MTKSLLRLPRHTAHSTPLLEAYFNGRLTLPIVTPDEDGARSGLTEAKKVRWNREVLVEVLKEQAQQSQAGSKAHRAIDDLLHDNTFTVLFLWDWKRFCVSTFKVFIYSIIANN